MFGVRGHSIWKWAGSASGLAEWAICAGGKWGLSVNKRGPDEVDIKKRKVYEHGLANPTSETSTDLRCTILAVINGQA